MSLAAPILFFAAMPGEVLPLTPEMAVTSLPSKRDGQSSASEGHATFGGYFQALGQMLAEDGFAIPMAGVKSQLGEDLEVSHVREWRVVAEKHGAFYHPARVEAVTERGTAVLAANVALSDPGRAAAEREYALLSALQKGRKQSFIPTPYGLDRTPCPLEGGGSTEAMALFCQWYAGYCEFHLSVNPESGKHGVIVWDNQGGHFFLDQSQAASLYEKAAAILSYYYDPENFRQIFPWHHAAGDFVVKVEDGVTDVRLITVRQYEGMIEAQDGADLESRVEAALYFLANLTMRMRLDRLDGVGDLVLAEDSEVFPCVRGIFQGLASREKESGEKGDFHSILLDICRELPQETWRNLCLELVEASSSQAPDRPLLLAHIEEHAQALVEAFSKSTGGPFFVDKGAVLL
ncbi:conserved hypothetical protein [Desulfatibacillum aliphaticivorans]|uniref:Uncharacterized protein n=2 Tax=Desulfatibacillum aliphaticivorans TaxID=218208 RepID=B8FME4_DESAL|nr:conserved hypothetical protein [Desulfatibacillum aliphaticivorans]